MIILADYSLPRRGSFGSSHDLGEENCVTNSLPNINHYGYHMTENLATTVKMGLFLIITKLRSSTSSEKKLQHFS